jgi:hypothetical protein
MAVTGIAIKTKPLSEVRPDVPLHEVTKGDLVRFNFFIDRAQLKALKTEALDREVSVADLVREALDARQRKT